MTTTATQAQHTALVTTRQKLTAEYKAKGEQLEGPVLKALDRKISACSHLMNPATQKPRKPRAKHLLAEASRLAFA
jgi:hypothetical protein